MFAVVDGMFISVPYRRPVNGLPRRVPGAALTHNPPPGPQQIVHVDPPGNVVNRLWVALVTWLRDWLTAESDESFTLWWARSTRATQPYHGRHRREELRQSLAWRNRWATWQTQAWPTLELDPFDDRAQRCRDRFPVNFLDPDLDAVPLRYADELPLPVPVG